MAADRNLSIDPSRKHYYVKTTGTGDGSSWEKAMSDEDFRNTLPNVPDGVTFHIAEGRYLQKDVCGESYDRYRVLSDVSIIGGYPANAKSGAVADPKRYETLFCGDLMGNDEPYFRNREENRKGFFVINAGVRISGLTFEGGLVMRCIFLVIRMAKMLS